MRPISLMALASLLACGSDPPTFPPPPVDAGIECSESNPCPDDGLCLAGRCHPPCTSNDDCPGSQVCGTSGFCMAGARPDAGPIDAGTDAPMDAGPVCDDCGDDVCHPSGECVACVEAAGRCGAAAPVCDFARGTCVAAPTRSCAACNADIDCEIDGIAEMRCVEGEGERVCLQTCGGDDQPSCPASFVCRGGVCQPGFGTCTAIVRADANTNCDDDADCLPLGATSEVELCRTDGARPTCRRGCTEESHCRGAEMCLDDVCVGRMVAP